MVLWPIRARVLFELFYNFQFIMIEETYNPMYTSALVFSAI